MMKRRILYSGPNIELQTAEDRRECLNRCHFIYNGLDLQFEINSVNTQNLGDTVVSALAERDLDVEQRKRLIGLAVCDCGAGTEAGSGTCYIKFGAVLPGGNAPIYFDNLVYACETIARAQHMSHSRC